MKKNVVLAGIFVLLVITGMSCTESSSSAAGQNKTYAEYIDYNKDAAVVMETIALDAESGIVQKSENVSILDTFQDAGKVLQIDGENGEMEWSVTVQKEGFYNILLDYCPLESKYTKIDLAIYVDGEIPFEEAGNLTLTRSWKNDGEIRSDSRGNNISPGQIAAPVWMKVYLHDAEGLQNENLRFFFSKGRHTIKIKSARSDFLLCSMELTNPEPLKPYKEVSGKYGAILSPDTDSIIIQGENAILKSDSILKPAYDRSDPATSPSDPARLLLNTIGGDEWKQMGQWIAWKVDIPEAGYYKIGLRARQNLLSGRNSYRRVYIDGKVPFAELDAVEFQFNNNWYMKTLGGSEPYMFYFEKGTHEIRLEIVPGELSKVRKALQDCVYSMNATYRKIIMITGTSPDEYRDYLIDKDIPDLLDTFAKIRDMLSEQKLSMEKISGKKGASSGLLESIINQMDSFIAKPDTIPLRLESYKANISSLSAWLLSVIDQPLEIDFIEVAPVNNKLAGGNSNILQKLMYSLRSIIGSFGTDYNIVGDYSNKGEAITVWVGMGRDQVQIVKDMVDNEFVPKTGIKVNISLVQQGLIEATLAGKGPDISLFVASAQPVNLAARGSLVDLRQFKDYDAVSGRFKKEALVPFSFEGGTYALPCTQSFPMLFYRKDIFSELGIDPPKNWDELYKIAPIIQRNNLQLGIGSDIGTFATFLYQKGGGFYNEKRSSTQLNTENAMNAFTQWTDFFTKYSLPLTYDFQNRFRTGEMPIGIAPYTLYNTLQVAAPEIKGLWDMTAIPATVKSDGTLDGSICGGSVIDGCIMFKKVKNRDAAWEFIKWFTSAQVQGRLGVELEYQMGPSARYATANVEALKLLPWNQEELSLLYKQWDNVREIPEIPASYYITRNINNAFRSVVYNGENPRHTLNQYNYEMNKEVKRKRIEFGLDVD